MLFVEILFKMRMKSINRTFPLFLAFTSFRPKNGKVKSTFLPLSSRNPFSKRNTLNVLEYFPDNISYLDF